MVAPADIAVLVLVAVTALIGFWTGLVWQVIRVMSVIASIWIAIVYHPVVVAFIGDRAPEAVRGFAAAAGIFLASMLVLYLVSYLFRDVVNVLKPQLPDRILGAGFGLLLGGLVGAFFAFAAMEYAAEDSAVARLVEKSSGARSMGALLRHALPDGVRAVIEEEGEEETPHPPPTETAVRDAPAQSESQSS